MTNTSPGITSGDAADALRGLFAALLDPAARASTSDDALLAMTRAVEDVGRVLDAVRVFAAGEIASRSRRQLGTDSLALRHGCRNAAEVMERVASTSSRTARARLRTGQALATSVSLTGEILPTRFPLVQSAVADGSLSVDAATAIVDELAPLGERGAEPTALRAAETELVDAALGCHAAAATPDALQIMAQAWALFLDPDGVLPDEAKGARRRALTLGRLRDGTVPVSGQLLPDVAAQLQRLIDAYTNPRVVRADPSGPSFVEDDPDDPVLRDVEHRNSAQKRHDALAGILGVAASHADAPTLGGAAPTLLVSVSAEDLHSPRGRAVIEGAEPGNASVSASVARHIGCTGTIQRVLRGSDGRILRLGVPDRVFTAHQRRAIGLRDGHCVIPGCTVAATWCEVHHVVPAAHDGPTHVDNGVLLCWWHHRTIDTGGWEIGMRGGMPWIRPPAWVDARRLWQPAVPPPPGLPGRSDPPAPQPDQ